MTRDMLIEAMARGIGYTAARQALAAIDAAWWVCVPRSLIEMADCWLTSALDCKEWQWDFDQHAAATKTRDALRALLAASPLLQEPGR